jgi:two-component system chemotaxis response regulator CheV
MENQILLESGTNELEIIEFRIDEADQAGKIESGYYAVNVGKVREIINLPKLTVLPDSPDTVAGIISIRNQLITVVNVARIIGRDTGNLEASKVIIMEFNNIQVGIMVHSVSHIHRISWAQIDPPVKMSEDGLVASMVKMEDRIIMLLDFEKIIAEICPHTALTIPVIETDEQMQQSRSDKTILIADDSDFIRKKMKGALEEAGYPVVTACDGQEALELLVDLQREAESKKKKLDQHVSLVITDIEMPRMDGLHLTRRIKENSVLKALPVLIFSSMASQENKRKWEEIGAERILTKPDLPNLINLVDEYLLG